MAKYMNFFYAAKAWWASVVSAATALVVAVEAATADKAISLTEVEGIVMLATALVGAVVAFGAVWAARNAGTNTPGVPSSPPPGV